MGLMPHELSKEERGWRQMSLNEITIKQLPSSLLSISSTQTKHTSAENKESRRGEEKEEEKKKRSPQGKIFNSSNYQISLEVI